MKEVGQGPKGGQNMCKILNNGKGYWGHTKNFIFQFHVTPYDGLISQNIYVFSFFIVSIL